MLEGGRQTVRRLVSAVTPAQGWDRAGRQSTQSLTTPLDGGGRVTGVRAERWTEEYAYDARGDQIAA